MPPPLRGTTGGTLPLYVDVRGLTTRRMHATSGTAFEITFDFVDQLLVIATSRGKVEAFELVDGLSVAEFDEKLPIGHYADWVSTSPFARRHTVCRLPHRFRRTGSTPPTTGMPRRASGASRLDRRRVEEFAGWYCGRRVRCTLARARSRRYPLQRKARVADAERNPDQPRGVLPRGDLVRILGR